MTTSEHESPTRFDEFWKSRIRREERHNVDPEELGNSYISREKLSLSDRGNFYSGLYLSPVAILLLFIVLAFFFFFFFLYNPISSNTT